MIDEAPNDHAHVTYEDATGDRLPPSAWDWQTLLSMALHGQAPTRVLEESFIKLQETLGPAVQLAGDCAPWPGNLS